jgi:peptidyl-tRNA hydrolase
VPTKAQYQYIIVRGDLSPGLQVAQTAHAALDFAIEYPDIGKQWKQESGYICILQVPDEEDLLDIVDLARRRETRYSLFYDPDVDGGSFTALAVEPGEFHLALSSLPLALREAAMT